MVGVSTPEPPQGQRNRASTSTCPRFMAASQRRPSTPSSTVWPPSRPTKPRSTRHAPATGQVSTGLDRRPAQKPWRARAVVRSARPADCQRAAITTVGTWNLEYRSPVPSARTRLQTGSKGSQIRGRSVPSWWARPGRPGTGRASALASAGAAAVLGDQRILNGVVHDAGTGQQIEVLDRHGDALALARAGADPLHGDEPRRGALQLLELFRQRLQRDRQVGVFRVLVDHEAAKRGLVRLLA